MSAPVDISSSVNQIYDKIKSLIANRKVDQAVLIEIATHCMELVEEMGNVPGATKKAIVLAVLARVVDELPVSDEVKSPLRLVVTTVLPTVIDKLVEFGNGNSFLAPVLTEIIGDGCCGKKKPAPAAKGRGKRRV